jgi:hypothetical protein
MSVWVAKVEVDEDAEDEDEEAEDEAGEHREI